MDFTNHEYRLIIAAGFSMSLGIILMSWSYIINLGEPDSIFAFLMLNIGGLFTIGGAYSIVNELYLKKHFAKEIQLSIDKKLSNLENDESINSFGLYKIEQPYTKELLINRIKKSKQVTMLAMRNNEFFSYHCPELLDMINAGQLSLTMAFFDPKSKALETLCERFNAKNPDELKNKLIENIDELVRKNIYVKLKEEQKSNLKLYLFDRHPTYSAYIFDDEELWLIPYFYRRDKRPVPIFMFSDEMKIKNTEIYKDIMGAIEESSEYNLQNEFNHG